MFNMRIRNAILFIAIQLACVLQSSAICPPGNVSLTGATCPHDPSIEIFAATYYSAMLVGNDPAIVYGMKMPAVEASKILFDTDIRVFAELGLCDSVPQVTVAASAVGLVEPFTLPVYFKNAAYCIGDFLVEQNMLNCGNAVSMGLSFYSFTKTVLKGMDNTVLPSYIEAIVKGMGMVLNDAGFKFEDLEDQWDHLADLFLKEYQNQLEIC